MRTIAAVCHVCGAPQDRERRESWYLHPRCGHCLAPNVRTSEVEAEDVERVMLAMVGLPSIADSWGCAIAVLLDLAPTVAEVERVRVMLHAIDVAALIERTRVAERARLDSMDVHGLDEDIEAALGKLRDDAATGLLRWRIDHICRTACAANDARAEHHRRLLATLAEHEGSRR